jgi:hypothetical protein
MRPKRISGMLSSTVSQAVAEVALARRLPTQPSPERIYRPAMRPANREQLYAIDAEYQCDVARLIAFMHVPKTSGTAVGQGLIRAFDPRRKQSDRTVRQCLDRNLDRLRRHIEKLLGRPSITLAGFDRSLFGGFDRFDTLHKSIRRIVHLDAASMPTGAGLVMGHFAYSTLRQAYPYVRLVTVLREPFCRLLSHWLFWRQQGDELLEPWGLWADRVLQARRPLADFLCSPAAACQIDNVVVRMLLWPHPFIPPDDFINPVHDEQLIDEAHARLDKFAYVDVVENPDLIAGLSASIGQPIDYRRVNETCGPPDGFSCDLDQHLASDSWELLARRSRLDLRLWNNVVMRNMPETTAHVVRTKALNASIARYQVLLKPPKNILSPKNVRPAAKPAVTAQAIRDTI